jgi:hypothetical protein
VNSSKSISSLSLLTVGVPDDFLAKWSLPEADRRDVSDLTSATELLADGGWNPDLVVVYQGVPDQFAASDVEVFVGRIPLTRCVVIFGPWCESVGRTEQVWPIGWCVPLQHAVVRLRQELAAWQNDEPPIPPTASRDEAFVSSAVRTLSDSGGVLSGRSVRIESLDRTFELFLHEAVQALGARLVEEDERADFELFATTLVDDSVLAAVAQRRAVSPEATLLVVTEMATPAEVENLTAAGCNRVLSQLRFVEQFVEAVAATSGEVVASR